MSTPLPNKNGPRGSRLRLHQLKSAEVVIATTTDARSPANVDWLPAIDRDATRARQDARLTASDATVAVVDVMAAHDVWLNANHVGVGRYLVAQRADGDGSSGNSGLRNVGKLHGFDDVD